MKWFLLCLSFWVVLSGCEDGAQKPGCPINYGSAVDPRTPGHTCDYVTASKDGEAWTVPASTSFGFQDDTLYVYGFRNDESLGFKFLFTGPGTYELATGPNNRYLSGHAWYYTIVGGDVITSIYRLDQKATVEIIEYNESERTIKGKFEFSFNEVYSASALSFKQGTFSVHLPD